MHRMVRLGLGVLAATLLAAGCGKGTRTTSPAGLTQDAADDAALQVAVSLGVVGTDVGAAGSAFATTAPPAGLSAAAYDTTFIRNGLTYAITRTFYDAHNDPMSGWNPLAVRMVWTSRAWGTLTGDRDTATVGHSASLDVRGIQAGADTLHVAGFSNDTLLNTFRSYDGTRTRHVHAVSDAEWSDVALLKDRAVDPWPLSGTMTWNVSVDRLRSSDAGDVESHFDAVVVIAFDGTGTPVVTVNGAWRYRLDLLTGVVQRI